VSLSLHPSRITITVLFCLTVAVAISCQKSSAQGNVASQYSFQQLKMIVRGTAQGSPLRADWDAFNTQQFNPGELPDQYNMMQQGGALSTAGSPLNTIDMPDADIAQSTVLGPVAHPPAGVPFTIPAVRPAHFGYPLPGDAPWHVWNYLDGNLNGVNPRTTQDAFAGSGAPPSNYVTAAAILTAAEQTGQALVNPSYPAEQAAFQGKMQQSEQASGQAAQNNFSAGGTMVQQSLINVANENAAQPLTRGATTRTLPQAIWMVQQVFKAIFLPMAILLVVPGAVLTQAKGLVHSAFSHSTVPSEDAISPFTGILRSIIAIFMIPATQLIISYSTDIGNSLTYQVQSFIDNTAITSWAGQQTAGTPPATMQQQASQQQAETGVQAMTGSIFNEVNMLLSYGMTVLIAYQIVMMSYLYLMGPIAAAFFAWPAGVGNLFKSVLANWLDAVTNLALWRFWWCVILLAMSTRIHWLTQMGQYNPQDPWEKAVYTAFMVMLTYVPFNPFDFRPGDLVDALLQKAGVKTDAA
jgi:hypothetical protein